MYYQFRIDKVRTKNVGHDPRIHHHWAIWLHVSDTNVSHEPTNQLMIDIQFCHVYVRLPVGLSQRFLTRLKKTHRHNVTPSSCHQPLSTLKKNVFFEEYRVVESCLLIVHVPWITLHIRHKSMDILIIWIRFTFSNLNDFLFSMIMIFHRKSPFYAGDFRSFNNTS